jgi:hypothetical protein
MHQAPDMVEQHKLLSYVATEIDAGNLKTTINEVLRPITAVNLRKAHGLVEQGNAIGKVVLADW